MTSQPQFRRGGEARRPSTDDPDRRTRHRGNRSMRQMPSRGSTSLDATVLANHTFQRANGDRRVDHTATARLFAGSRTHMSADARKWIVRTRQVIGVREAPVSHRLHVSRCIRPDRARNATRHVAREPCSIRYLRSRRQAHHRSGRIAEGAGVAGARPRRDATASSPIDITAIQLVAIPTRTDRLTAGIRVRIQCGTSSRSSVSSRPTARPIAIAVIQRR